MAAPGPMTTRIKCTVTVITAASGRWRAIRCALLCQYSHSTRVTFIAIGGAAPYDGAGVTHG
jgi:hypothetical protein